MAKLSEGSGASTNNGIISGVLVTVGDLARVVGNSISFVIDFSTSYNVS